MPLDAPESLHRLGRWDSPPPSRLSRELRLGRSPDLARRRWIIGLSMVGGAIGHLVAAYQTGMIRRLPDPPKGLDLLGTDLGRLFDATRVDASDYAYRRGSLPDGLMMSLTYAVTAALAGAGGRDRARQQPALPILMAAKTLYDVVTCLRLAREEWQDNHAFCQYCQLATLASLVSAGLALPEAIWALATVLGADQPDGMRRDGRARRMPRPDPHYHYGADLARTTGLDRGTGGYDEDEAYNDVAMYP